MILVIELAAEPFDRSNNRVHYLATVSLRFRTIALNLPRIWCSVSSWTHSSDRALLHVERSKSMGLHVSLQDLDEPIHCSALLQAVVPFASQWRSFSYTGHHPITHRLAVTEHRIPLQLPLLECLGVEEDFDHVYRKYFMPNLRSARFNNMIPKPFSNTLTYFTMNFWWRIDLVDELWDIDKFREFLLSTPLLEELRLRFDMRFRSLECELSDREVLLPNLKTLTISAVLHETDWKEDGEPSETASDFLGSIRAPNLTHVTLAVKVYNGHSPEEAVSNFTNGLLPSSSAHPKLTSLDFLVFFEEVPYLKKYEVRPILRLLYDHIPNLTHLKLETNLDVVLVHPGDKFFPLRHVNFIKCDFITNELVAKLFKGLWRDPLAWEALKKVVFRACPLVDLNGAFSVVTEGKFCYEQYRQPHNADVSRMILLGLW
ncbi:hypothetical protein SCHPADRAFT_286553 [Schizopora paradoxa]|uniref:F-box domain-containing protein n=1 Tax=Schizopora paradoxa TaxID=27342 RepID=A0A0H2RTP9_9AGAM|nr:hypothetical protein SCHPADRAFT_286553 [Schizopora paradoxa]